MRAIAIRIPLKEFDSAEFVRIEEKFEPSYADTKKGLKVSRTSVFGVVVRRFESEKLVSLSLDDFTSTVDVLFFEEAKEIAAGINEGNAVKVIGRVKTGKNGIFIAGEGIQKLDFLDEMFKRLEIMNLYEKAKKSGGEKKSKGKEKPEEKEMLSDFVQAGELHVESEVIE